MAHPSPPPSEEFEQFFRETNTRVVGLVAMMTGTVAAAEDATQEAYARAFQRWDRLRTYDRPDLWVVRVAGRLAIDHWRRRRREQGITDSRQAAIRDDVEHLWVTWGLAALTPRQRAATILHHVEGRGLAEVAAMTGTSTETVKTHLKRARVALRRRWGGDE